MKKTNPSISYDEFFNFIKPITQFKSLKGNSYSVISIEDTIITFPKGIYTKAMENEFKRCSQSLFRYNRL